MRRIGTTGRTHLHGRLQGRAAQHLADASLIWVAETTGVLDMVTLDRRDFGIYRTARGKALRNVLDTGA